MEKVPARAPGGEGAPALEPLRAGGPGRPRAVDFLRKDWAELLGDPDAAAAAARGQAGIDLDAGGEMTCPACGHVFALAEKQAECPECGLGLGAPSNAAPDEGSTSRSRSARMPRELTDLHIHVGGAVAPHVLWSIAHEQGFKLPVSDYWEFKELVSARPGKVKSLDEYLAVLHQWTEKIQSSPQAMERSVYEVIGKEYRSSRVSLIELRFNPMKRNVGGERDLDHIIHAALRGMDRAVLEYGVRAGLIFCLAREFDLRLNEILVEKAIRYRRRGVVGIDLAGTERERARARAGARSRATASSSRGRARRGSRRPCTPARRAGTGAEGVRAVVEELEPHRIGHGICAAKDERVMDAPPRARHRARDLPELEPRHARGGARSRSSARSCAASGTRGVKFTINTDGPYLLDTNMRSEVEAPPRRRRALGRAARADASAGPREATFVSPDLDVASLVEAIRARTNVSALSRGRGRPAVSASSSAAAVRASSSAVPERARLGALAAIGVPHSSRGASTPGK